MHTTNIIFTDYQTVIGLDNTVYKTQDFFNLVETRIRSGEIINCDYDIRNKKLTFMYDYEKYQINISDDEKESYTNSIPLKKIYILMTLFELEKEIRIQREKERQDEFKKEELLNKAKSGKIDSKEVRDLYIKSLKEDKKNNIKGIFKPNYHYKKLPCPNIYDFLLTIAMLLLAIVALPILKSSVIFVISLVTAISNVIALGCGFSMVDKIFFSFKNYIKSIFKKNRLIDYKIMN